MQTPAADAASAAVELSVVLPACNEQENVGPLWEELRGVLIGIGRPFEVVVVDDGSVDETYARLRAAAASDPRLRPVRHVRNYGQTAALATGIRLARGSIIITLDADRQNDPNEIPRMLGRLDGGVDVVCGWRRRRQDKWLRSCASRLANRLICRLTGVDLHDYGCTLKVFRAGVAKRLPLAGELHRFIPALARWEGARLAEVEVNHRPRVAGRSHYGLDRTFRVLLDLATLLFMTRYYGHAARFFGRWAWPLALVAVMFLAIGAAGWALPVGAGGAARVWPPVVMLGGLMCALTSIVLVALGVLGELGWRVLFALQAGGVYRVMEEGEGSARS